MTNDQSIETLRKIADRLGIDYDSLSVPFHADRWARIGETCTCGKQAIVVYRTRRMGDLGYCGGNHG